MRFFEVAFNVRDLRIEKLAEWAREQKINESEDFSNEVNEYRKFISNFITDIKSISVGEEYRPVTLFARPAAQIIEVSTAPQSVKLIDIDSQGDFNFQIGNNLVKFPGYYEDTDVQLPYFMSTTLFITASDVNKFFTLLNLQFYGRWTLVKREFRS